MLAKIKAFLTANNIQRRLLLILSFFIFSSIILVSFFSHLRFVSDYTNQSAKDIQQIVEQVALNVDTYIDEVARLCLSPYYNSSVMSRLDSQPSNAQETLEKRREIEDYLRQVMITPREDIIRVYILSDSVYSSSKSGHIGLNSDYKSEEWYQAAQNTDDYIFLPAHSEDAGPSPNLVISIAKRLCSLQNNQKTIGVIRVDANYNGIQAVCDRIHVNEGGALFIMDSNWNPVYQNSALPEAITFEEICSAATASGYSTQKLDGATYIVNVGIIPSTNWRVIAVNAKNQVIKGANATLVFNMFLAVGMAALGVAVSIFFVRRQLRPLYQTVNLMEEVEDGNLTVRANTDCTDEIASLNSAFNHMLEQIQEMMDQEKQLTKQVYEAKYLQKEAQFESLHRQIQPHFLFNTLNTINLLIKCGRPKEATQGIEQLATLLRGVINSGREITLEAELKIADSYLRLQKLRHDNLTYQINVSDIDLSYTLPALTIQPIIENALIHGCEKAEGDTHILVDLRYCNHMLMISVKDNGAGMAAHTLQQLQTRLDNCELEKHTGFQASGIGLVNIQKRIRFQFGSPYGITLSSAEGRGTTVTLSIPRSVKSC
mgnify:CR=1 FL=1